MNPVPNKKVLKSKRVKAPAVRLWVILARETAVAVIFRRGPTRQVQMIKWHLKDNTFEYGQWFKGRVYERRCDLSPKGDLLIYFAATFKKPLYSWTAVSKPPWFTALALWPKGDGWNGGGHFVGSHAIHLDHRSDQSTPHPDFVSNCRKFRIASHAEWRGEDAPVWHATLQRDGWVLTNVGTWNKCSRKMGYSWEAKIPEEWRKKHPTKSWVLQMQIEAIGQTDGPWYVVRYRVLDKEDAIVLDLGRVDWANWVKGELSFAKSGCLYRQKIRQSGADEPQLLADFTGQKFEAIAPPARAIRF